MMHRHIPTCHIFSKEILVQLENALKNPKTSLVEKTHGRLSAIKATLHTTTEYVKKSEALSYQSTDGIQIRETIPQIIYLVHSARHSML